jgi:hypothetical protein
VFHVIRGAVAGRGKQHEVMKGPISAEVGTRASDSYTSIYLHK